MYWVFKFIHSHIHNHVMYIFTYIGMVLCMHEYIYTFLSISKYLYTKIFILCTVNIGVVVCINLCTFPTIGNFTDLYLCFSYCCLFMASRNHSRYGPFPLWASRYGPHGGHYGPPR